MYEYKTERVAPAQQNNLVNTYAAFGWELMSAQETYHESTEITGVHAKARTYGAFMQGFTGDDGKVTTTVETARTVTNYVTLQFRRDTSIPNYAKLVELEHKALDLFPTRPAKPNKPIARTVLSVICAFFLIVSLIRMTQTEVDVSGFDLVIVGIMVILFVLTLIGWIVYSKKKGAYKAALIRYNNAVEECADYYHQAQELTFGK